MKIFMCDLGLEEPRYCMVGSDGFPGRILMAMGQSARERFFGSGRDAVMLTLNESFGGLKLPDLVSNLEELLVLHNSCAERIFQNFRLGDYELLPAVIVNSKKRVHSRDYVVVNLLGLEECLDVERSEMSDVADAPWVRPFGEFWLDRARIPRGRDLFRVKGTMGYMFSEGLCEFIRSQGFTNFVFRDVQLS